MTRLLRLLDSPAAVGLALVILAGVGLGLNVWAYHAPV